MNASSLQTDALFTQYMHIVNRALSQHRNEMPYKQLLKLGDKTIGGKPVGVAVYKDDPNTPHEHFEVTFDGGTFDVTSHGKADANIFWKVPQDHLENVVEEPDDFVASPSKLDLDWFKERVGIA